MRHKLASHLRAQRYMWICRGISPTTGSFHSIVCNDLCLFPGLIYKKITTVLWVTCCKIWQHKKGLHWLMSHNLPTIELSCFWIRNSCELESCTSWRLTLGACKKRNPSGPQCPPSAILAMQANSLRAFEQSAIATVSTPNFGGGSVIIINYLKLSHRQAHTGRFITQTGTLPVQHKWCNLDWVSRTVAKWPSNFCRGLQKTRHTHQFHSPSPHAPRLGACCALNRSCTCQSSWACSLRLPF